MRAQALATDEASPRAVSVAAGAAVVWRTNPKHASQLWLAELFFAMLFCFLLCLGVPVFAFASPCLIHILGYVPCPIASIPNTVFC